MSLSQKVVIAICTSITLACALVGVGLAFLPAPSGVEIETMSPAELSSHEIESGKKVTIIICWGNTFSDTDPAWQEVKFALEQSPIVSLEVNSVYSLIRATLYLNDASSLTDDEVRDHIQKVWDYIEKNNICDQV